jgi:hypothetical protein
MAMENVKFKKYLISSTIIQLIFVVLALTSTDMRELAAAFSYAAISYWTGFLIIKIRRPSFENKTDQMFMRIGLIILSLLSVPVSISIWAFMDKW